MASLVKKIIRGHPYYYARVCKRVDGKPKIVSQTHLGRADKIVEKLRAGPVPAQPREAVVREIGASTALFTLARRLRLVEHSDRHVPKRGSGPSVGHYLLAAVLNRCLAPGSKASLARWFDATALGRLLPLRRWRDGKIHGGRKPGVATTRKTVDGRMRTRHMRELLDVQVREEDGLPKVNYRFQSDAWEHLQRTLVGKTLLLTDQADWSDAELVRGYRT